MINNIKKSAEQKMKRSVDSLSNTLSKLRTGRAHPSLIEHIKVDYYGSETPLNQVANIGVLDSRTLTVTPWDKSMAKAVEKAIMTSELGLNPASAGEVIRVPLPALTEERRKDLIKVVRQEAEDARVSVRNIRRDANSEFKDLLKEKALTEDDERRAQNEVQKLTDNYIKQIDELVGHKEKDLMEI